MFDFAPVRKRRRISLTPMIDVVFLLLIFFMLVSRFGTDMHVALGLASGSGDSYSGPPRLVTVLPEGVELNGIAVDDIAAEVAPLTESAGDIIVLKAAEATDLGRVVAVMDDLRGAGFSHLVLVE
ncbi:ExbD/TolR family protein [Marivivens aquimaris]|uniref:ExbD/TolR family protein n=1 Tax=Marivivens aquimaris TaxID=2774876 RepID=UPI001881ACE4|nr:biopolymer transporter ExbD [Marivivens aquimaris]